MASSAWKGYDEEQLFEYAIEGRVRKLQKLLEKYASIPVDVVNNKGQTLLYICCLYRRVKTASFLLELGADPNRRSDDGSTPTHAAAYSCSVELLRCIVEEYGGDMRLHDKLSRTPKDWAMRAGKKVSKKVLHLIKTWQESVDSNLLLKGNPRNTKSWPPDLYIDHEYHDLLKNDLKIDFHGYGDYLCRTNHKHESSFIGLPAVLPLASLCHFAIPSSFTLAFRSPPCFLMEEALWCGHTVMIKRARGKDQTALKANEDLLLTEAKACRGLRHPNLLLLMAINLSSSEDSYANAPSHRLVFEPIRLGSLHHVLHKLGHSISFPDVANHMIQIAAALSYIHERGFVHCVVSSHAVYLTDMHTAKLGDLIYVTVSGDKVNSHCPVTSCLNRWVAPEIILDQSVSIATDVYSFCTVISEAFSGTLPWTGCGSDSVKKHILSRRNYSMLPDDMPVKLRNVLQKGLKYSSTNRRLQLVSISSCLKELLENDDLEFVESSKKTAMCHMTGRFEKPQQAGDLLYKEWDIVSESKEDCLNEFASGIDVPDAKPIRNRPLYKACKTEPLIRENSKNSSSFLQQNSVPIFQKTNNASNIQAEPDLCPPYREAMSIPGVLHDCRNGSPLHANTECKFSHVNKISPLRRVEGLNLHEYCFGGSFRPVLAKRPRSCGVLVNGEEEPASNALTLLPASCPDITNFDITPFEKPICKRSKPQDVSVTATLPSKTVRNAIVQTARVGQPTYQRHSSLCAGSGNITRRRHETLHEKPILPKNKVSVGTNTDMDVASILPPIEDDIHKVSGVIGKSPPSLMYMPPDLRCVEYTVPPSTTDDKQLVMTDGIVPNMNLKSSKEIFSKDDKLDGVYDISDINCDGCTNDEQTGAKKTFSNCMKERKRLGTKRVRRLSLPVVSSQCGHECVYRKSLSHLDNCIDNVDSTSEIDWMFDIESHDLEEIFRGFSRRGMHDVKGPKHETVDKLVGGEEMLEDNIPIDEKHHATCFTKCVVDENKQQSNQIETTSPFPYDAKEKKIQCVSESHVEDSPSATFVTCMDGNLEDSESLTQIHPAEVYATEMGIAASLTNDNIEVEDVEISEDSNFIAEPIKMKEAGECQLNADQTYIQECHHTPKCEAATTLDDQTDGMKTPSKWSFDKKLSLFKVRAEVDDKLQRRISVACRAMFEGDGTASKPLTSQTSESDNAKADIQKDGMGSNLEHRPATCFEKLAEEENEFKTSTPVLQTNSGSRSKPVEYKEPLTPRSFADVRADIEAASSPVKCKTRYCSAKTSLMTNSKAVPVTKNDNASEKETMLTNFILQEDSDSNNLSSIAATNVCNTTQTSSGRSPTTVNETAEEEVEGAVSQLLHDMLCITSNEKPSEINSEIKNVSTINDNSLPGFDETDSNLNSMTDDSFVNDLRILAPKPVACISEAMSRSLPSNLDESLVDTKKYAKENFLFIPNGTVLAQQEEESVMTEGNGQECSSLLLESSTSQANLCCSVDTSVWSV